MFTIKLYKFILFSIFIFTFSSCAPQISKEDCAKAAKKNVLVLDLDDDKYNCKEDVEIMFKSQCFTILNKKQLGFKKITFEQAIELANTIQIDVIVYGYVTVKYFYNNNYTEPIKPSGNLTAKGTEAEEKRLAKEMSGSWACVTIFGYQTDTKERIDIWRERKTKKVGGE